MATNVDAQICVRRDTAANWTSSDPVLLNGEVGYDTTNNKIKIGNGTSTWTALSYLTDATGGGSSYSTEATWSTDFLTSVPLFSSLQQQGTNPEYFWQSSGTTAISAESPPSVSLGSRQCGRIYINTQSANSWIRVGSSPAPVYILYPYIDNRGMYSYVNTLEMAAIVEVGNASAPGTLYVGTGQTWGAGNGAKRNPEFDADSTGFYFKYNPSINGGRWQCRLRTKFMSNPVATYSYDSGVSVSTGGQYNLKVVCTQGVGTFPTPPTIAWFINGTQVASVDGNTLPLMEQYGLMALNHALVSIEQGASEAASTAMYVDYMHLKTTFTTNR